MPTRQLLVYTFGPGAGFEGQLVGALERIESGGAIRVLDALFIARQPATADVTAVSLSGGSGGIISQLLDFRLDPGRRTAATKRAFESPAGEIITALAARLGPGSAFAAVLVEHVWAGALSEAVARTGGAEATSQFVN